MPSSSQVFLAATTRGGGSPGALYRWRTVSPPPASAAQVLEQAMAAATPAAPAAAAMVLASMAAALGLGCLRGVAGGEFIDTLPEQRAAGGISVSIESSRWHSSQNSNKLTSDAWPEPKR